MVGVQAGTEQERCSATWLTTPRPAIAVVVTSYGRSRYLPALVACLAAQDLPAGTFEVVIVDNGSGDDTWEVLRRVAESTTLPLLAVHVDRNREGPGGGRNAGVARTRAPVIAFTDDDCLPTPGWLSTLLDHFDADVDVVQGRVRPDPGSLDAAGPWDHRIDIGGRTPWFETANVAYRRRAFDAAGGFDEHDSLTGRRAGRRAFGEDAVLAWNVLGHSGRSRFAQTAVVDHRVVPTSFGRLLRDWRDLAGFPGLVRRSGIAGDSLWLGVFLNEQTAVFDLAALSAVAAAVSRQPAFLIATLPWAWRRWGMLRPLRSNRWHVAVMLLQRATIEGVGLASLLEGSVRHRRLVL